MFLVAKLQNPHFPKYWNQRDEKVCIECWLTFRKLMPMFDATPCNDISLFQFLATGAVDRLSISVMILD